jgi:VWFA-related protein
MITLLLALVEMVVPATEAEIRTLTVAVTDAKGAPVAGLRPEELAVLENGVARDIVTLVRDERPLTLALVVDSSGSVGSHYRLHVVPAVSRFLARLPAGSACSAWTTGDRPTRVVELSRDPSEVTKALQHVVPQGGNRLFDALVEASGELRRKEGERSLVVAVTGLGAGFTNQDRYATVERAGRGELTFVTVAFDETASGLDEVNGGEVSRTDYDYVLAALPERTGGMEERLLTAMGLDKALDRVAADLAAQWRLGYATLPGLAKRKLEVTVARRDVKVRLGAVQQ